MDKLTIATQVLLKLIETDKTGFDAEGIAAYSFEIADAMQAEAEKRKPSGLPEALCEVDWSVAPCWAKEWVMRDGVAKWECGISANSWEDAPSFGSTGSHIVERPHGF